VRGIGDLNGIVDHEPHIDRSNQQRRGETREYQSKFDEGIALLAAQASASR
jgi:hypothetical protein